MYHEHNRFAIENTVGTEHINDLYRYALHLSRNHADAEDLVQETYVRAIGAIDKLRDDGNLKSWLNTILRNIWLNERQRQRRVSDRIGESDVDENIANLVAWNSKDAHACYVSKLERDHVRSAIHQITRKCREVLILREYQDMSYQEIAVVLDCPIGTVMSRLGRARAKLRALLSVNCWFTKSAERVRRERE